MSPTFGERGGAAALILAAAVVVAACSSSGGASAAPSASAAAPAASAAAPSTAPSVEASVAPPAESSTAPEPTPSPAEATTAPEPSVAASIDPFAGLNKDPDLEARLPDSYGGTKLIKLSFSGKDFPADPDTTKFLAAIGKSYADLSMAVASTQGGDPVFMAIRIKGASEGDLKKVFQISAQQAAQTTPNVHLTETTVDGVPVFQSTDTDTGSVSYFVVRGDTALGVSGKTEASAKKAFAALAK